jgi:hypothetical protein
MMKSFPAMCVLLLGLSLSACQCNPPACAAGAVTCACKEGSVCNDGLVCGSDQKCAPAVSAGVQVSDATARGCEFLLTESAGTEVVSVAFKNGAKGTWIREAPKVAVTVVAGGDTALTGAIDLGLSGSVSNLTISKTSCVDVTGQRLASTISIR